MRLPPLTLKTRMRIANGLVVLGLITCVVAATAPRSETSPWAILVDRLSGATGCNVFSGGDTTLGLASVANTL